MKKVLIITDEKKSSYNQCEALLYYLKKKVKLKTEHIKIKRELTEHWMQSNEVDILLIQETKINQTKAEYRKNIPGSLVETLTTKKKLHHSSCTLAVSTDFRIS